MTQDFGPLLRALARVGDDLRDNPPLPPPETMTHADALAALQSAQQRVEAVTAWLTLHPGAYWALRRVLTALAAMRVGWAVEALAAMKALPGALVTAHTWLPRLTGLLKMAQAAPRSGPPVAEADWSGGWKGPQPVDNPSGAIGGPEAH